MSRPLRHTLCATALIAALAGPAAAATDVGYSRRFGLGIMLGEPTGITGKLWVSQRNALDFGLGFGFYNYRKCDRYGCYGGYDGMSLNIDYLWHPSVLARGSVELNWHIGVGGRVWFWDYYDRGYRGRGGFLDVALRAPVGLDLMFNNPSFLEIYAEITPSLYLFGPGFGFEGGIGIRFYF